MNRRYFTLVRKDVLDNKELSFGAIALYCIICYDCTTSLRRLLLDKNTRNETIKYQNNIIESLKEELTSIKEMASSLIQNVKEIATDLYKVLKRNLGLNVDKNQKYDYYTFKDLSKKVNKKYERDKSDDFEL